MPTDQKITDLVDKPAPVAGDLFVLVDPADTTMGPTGTNKRSTLGHIAASIKTMLGLAPSATTDTTNASNITAGTLPAGRLPALTGDVTTPAGSVATTLANTAVTPGTYTYSTITVDSKGRVVFSTSGTTPPSTPPGGSTGQLQVNNGGAFAGMGGSVVATSGNILTLTAPTINDIPLVVKGAGASGVLTQWQDNSGNLVLAIAVAKQVTIAAGTAFVVSGAGSNFTINDAGGYSWTTQRANAATGSQVVHVFTAVNQQTGTASFLGYQWHCGESSFGSGSRNHTAWSHPGGVVMTLDRWIRPVFAQPNIATIAAGPGAGTGAAVSLTGNEISGAIYLNTGTTPTASATVLTVTFSHALPATPCNVLLTPANGAAAALTGAGQVWADASLLTTGGFGVFAGTALVASRSYVWFYRVHG
jgi:hypothetical protein